MEQQQQGQGQTGWWGQAQQLGNTVGQARSLWDQLWAGVGFVFQAAMFGIPLLLGGGALLNHFHDQPWAQGIMRFLAPMVEGFLNFLPGDEDSGVEGFFRGFLGNFRQHLSAEAVRDGLESAGLSEALAEAAIPDGADGDLAVQAAMRALNASGQGAMAQISRGNVVGAIANERTLSQLLRDRNGGQAMIRRMLPVMGRELREAEDAEEGETSESNPILLAVQNLLNNEQLFEETVAVDGVWELLYEAAQEIGGVDLTDAREALDDLTVETRRQLFAAFVTPTGVPDPAQISRAMLSIVRDDSITSQTIHQLLTSIDLEGAEDAEGEESEQGSTRQILTRMRGLEIADIEDIRSTINQLDDDVIERLMDDEQQIATLAELATTEGSSLYPDPDNLEESVQNLQNLALLADLPTELSSIVENEEHAGLLLGLINDMGAEDFTQFAGALQTVSAEPDAVQREAAMTRLVAELPNEDDRTAVAAFLRATGTIDTTEEGQLRDHPGVVNAYTRFLAGTPFGEDERDALEAAMADVGRNDYSSLVDLLGNERFQQQLAATRVENDNPQTTDDNINAALRNIAAVFAAQAAEDENNLQAVFLSTDNDNNAETAPVNLQALYTLTQRIGADASESERDMMTFAIAMLTGQGRIEKTHNDPVFHRGNEYTLYPAGITVKAEDLSQFINAHRVALTEFFRTPGLGENTPYAGVFAELRQNFWHDGFQRWANLGDDFEERRRTADGEVNRGEGLLQVLVEGDALGMMLNSIAGGDRRQAEAHDLTVRQLASRRDLPRPNATERDIADLSGWVGGFGVDGRIRDAREIIERLLRAMPGGISGGEQVAETSSPARIGIPVIDEMLNRNNRGGTMTA